MLLIITGNQASFHDVSIIDYLNEIIISSAKTNPYLLEYWLEFKTQYKTAKQADKHSQNTLNIKIGPEGTSSEGMIRDLRNALVATQNALTLGQQAQNVEMELLRTELQELRLSHTALLIQNNKLLEQVRNEQLFASLHPQILSAQEQITTLSHLLGQLNTLTIKTAPPAEVKELLIVTPVAPSTLNPNKEDEPTNESIPIPPPLTPPSKNFITEPCHSEEKESPKPLSRSSFFDELASKIKERQTKKAVVLEASFEKKN